MGKSMEKHGKCIDKGRKSMKINGKTIQDGEQQQKMLVCTKWIKGIFSHV